MVDASAEQGQSPGRSARAIAASEAAIPYCQRHSDTETELRCGRCEVEICPRCMIHAPGGIRCPDCAQLRRPPMYELETSHYLRAGGVALLGAGAIGVASALLLPPRPVGGLLLFAIALFAGMGAATLLARAFDAVTNRKRGRALQLLAAGAIVVAALLRLLISGELDLITRDASGIVFAAIGAIVAWNRLA